MFRRDQAGRRRVALTHLPNGLVVSTVELPWPMGTRRYETCVIGTEVELFGWYETHMRAEAGHQLWVDHASTLRHAKDKPRAA